jgi:L-ribulose-5-phosphate 3-epimerase
LTVEFPGSIHSDIAMRYPRISCFTNSYGRFGGEAALAHLPEIDVEFLELPIRTAGAPGFFGDQPLVTTAATLTDVTNLKGRFADAGLRVSSCNVTSGNPLDPQVLNVTLKKMDLAALFQVDLVVGGGGEAYTEADRKVLYQNLRAIGDHAESLGMVYCLETHPGLCQHPDSMLEAMTRLDHPRLKLNFDTGNILYYNRGMNVADALKQVRDHVRHVHLKDTNGNYREWHFPALGTGGAVDFAQVKHILDEVGYNGPYSLEIEGIEGEAVLSLADYQTRIAESITHLKRCGFY